MGHSERAGVPWMRVWGRVLTCLCRRARGAPVPPTSDALFCADEEGAYPLPYESLNHGYARMWLRHNPPWRC